MSRKKKKKVQVFVTFDASIYVDKNGNYEEEDVKEHIYTCLRTMISDQQLGFSIIPIETTKTQVWQH